jgi:hypothetical protein
VEPCPEQKVLAVTGGTWVREADGVTAVTPAAWRRARVREAM